MTLFYSDELVKLYFADSREEMAWLSADVLVTDPPYGIRWAKDGMHYNKKVRAKQNVITGDDSTDTRDQALLMWGNRPALVFGTWRQPKPPATRHRLIWHKSGSRPGMTNAAWYSADEEIYVLGEGFTGSPDQTVYRTNEIRSGRGGLSTLVGHPTPKPIELMEQLIAKCPPGVIADPFAGSGSTLTAAKNLGRRAIGVEIEERYCQLAAEMLSTQQLDFGEWKA